MKSFIVLSTTFIFLVIVSNSVNAPTNKSVSKYTYMVQTDLKSIPIDYNFIKSFEGYSEKRYKCKAGIWTIGYGHTETALKLKRIDEKTANLLFVKDVAKAESLVANTITVPINENQKTALVSLAYNIGPRFITKRNGDTTMFYKKLQEGDLDGAANYFTCFVYAKGRKLHGLVKRRLAEKELFTTPA